MNKQIKVAFNCSSVNEYLIDPVLPCSHIPKAGDVGIFKVLSEKGRLMTPGKFECSIFEGDYIMAAFGSRYATNQVEGYVPKQPVDTCHLLSRGGLAGELKSINTQMRLPPVELQLVGYALNPESGEVINTVQEDKLHVFDPFLMKSKVILSIGTSMDSGKTTSAAYLCGGLHRQGFTVAYMKLTGTAYPKDAQLNADLGADYVCDFSDLGFPSTFGSKKSVILDLFQTLHDRAYEAVQPEYLVVEIADGLLQQETYQLLSDERFMQAVSGVLFNAGDSLGVMAGLEVLKKLNIVPFAVAGLFTASELLIDEMQHVCKAPVLRLSDLLSAAFLPLLERMMGKNEVIPLLARRA